MEEKSIARYFSLKVLLILSLGHLVTDIYQGALPAILPFLKQKLALSYTMAGIIMMASNLTSSVIQPIFGHLSDRKEKAFFIPLGCLAAGIGLSSLSLPNDVSIVFLLVILSGLGVASFHPEGYKTAHFFTGDRMATGMSVFSVGGNLGFALGPIISLFIITQLGFDYLPIMVIFCLVFLVVIFRSWHMLNLRQASGPTAGVRATRASRMAYVSLFLVIATVVMRSWTQMGLMTFIPFYYIDYLKGEPLYAGSLVSTLLLGGVAGTLAGSPVADRWGHKRYLILSMAVAAALMPLIFIVSDALMFVVLALIGMTLISSFTVTIVMAQQLLPHNLGVASGLMVGFAIGTGGIGVTVLGWCAD
ncbi:MAG: MFS transporter, partial [Deltaproteobacteria bacterium]|nr:MFS transporter [Deltaproteobacteria bacterium]